MKNSIKSISTINPAIVENTECSIIKARALFIDLKVGVSLDHAILLCFVSLLVLQTCWTTFQTKSNIRSTPASSALTLVSHRSHNTLTENRHLCGKGERNGAQRRVLIEP